MFWNSLEIPKKREVASLVGNLSPVKSSRAIFVRRIRHLRGDIGEELNRRAVVGLQRMSQFPLCWGTATFLKYRGSIHLHNCLIRILIFLSVAHLGLSSPGTLNRDNGPGSVEPGYGPQADFTGGQYTWCSNWSICTPGHAESKQFRDMGVIAVVVIQRLCCR